MSILNNTDDANKADVKPVFRIAPDDPRFRTDFPPPAKDATARQVAEHFAKQWELLWEPEQEVFEVRAIDYYDWKKPETWFGFFDRAHAVDMALAAMAATGKAKGVYSPVNQIDPVLLHRRCNQFLRADDTPTTKDQNILRRTKLFIDIDPRKPDKHISATNAEKQGAFDGGAAIIDRLTGEFQFPLPSVIDSGNGCYLIFRINEPADDAGLIHRVLQAIKQQFDSLADIDVSVGNAARIAKLVGTWAKKGSNTAERPHRRSKFIAAPVSFDVVSHEQLEAVAAMLKPEAGKVTVEIPKPEANGHHSAFNMSASGTPANETVEHKLDIKKYLTNRGISIKFEKPWNDAYLYGIVCPFDPMHGEKTDTVVGQFASGAPFFKCQHNGCVGNKWEQLKGKIGKPKNDEYDPPKTKKRGPKRASVEFVPGSSMVMLTTKEYDNAEAVTAILAKNDPDLYQRGGLLSRIRRSVRPPKESDRISTSGGPRIEPLPQAALRATITRYVELVKDEYERIVPAHPTAELVNAIHTEAALWTGIRPLELVADSPLLKPDGTILQTAGYDRDTGILYEPSGDFEPIPNNPTRDDALRRLDELLEVVCDFPFQLPAHRSAWVVSALTPLAKPAFDGPAPLFLTDANVRGSGKGLSASCAALIATGRPFAISQYSHDDVEMRKIITSIALSGERMVLLDNLSVRLWPS